MVLTTAPAWVDYAVLGESHDSMLRPPECEYTREESMVVPDGARCFDCFLHVLYVADSYCPLTYVVAVDNIAVLANLAQIVNEVLMMVENAAVDVVVEGVDNDMKLAFGYNHLVIEA